MNISQNFTNHFNQFTNAIDFLYSLGNTQKSLNYPEIKKIFPNITISHSLMGDTVVFTIYRPSYCFSVNPKNLGTESLQELQRFITQYPNNIQLRKESILTDILTNTASPVMHIHLYGDNITEINTIGDLLIDLLNSLMPNLTTFPIEEYTSIPFYIPLICDENDYYSYRQ